MVVALYYAADQLDLPVRATADADIGVRPTLLLDDALVGRIEALGYRKTIGALLAVLAPK